ncbi:nitrate reductase [Microbulbifer yueqingensis]|uniref:Assimilatory nitrate reductase (NADH) alpha subunit apoprotein n=1 Tax=Microbulbifer yueqingensis TaxID=658219 RepID=A0A1G8XM53_9GAMM|nr:nitrate reductase [Microbulbifer yueqingensis]SDJ91689.1 assimilatory nitrate reductase (NADH) alpha subunit apoprotein [Microbulbifer yueqingensis]
MAPTERLRAHRSCTTCPYCGVGCGVSVTRQVATSDAGVSVEGDRQHPANRGRLCVKGSALAETLGERGRLLRPRLHGRECDWETAMGYMAEQFSRTIERHGPDSVAFYLSGQLLTEDYYVANKLMKGFIGSGNVDTNSRLCMSSAVAAYKRSLGADAVPCCYEDLEHADLVVLVGSNAAWTHPILFQRMQQAQAKLVVIDPRASATSETADLHLAITPGSDAALFSGLLNYLVQGHHIDRQFVAEHSDGFQQAAAAAAAWGPDRTARTCGLALDELLAFYQLFASTKKTITFYSQGINQSTSGTDKNNAIINCHLATGRIGRPGCGPFSITGQPNAMGGREVGGLANMLAAHMDYRADHIDRVSRFWQASNIARRPGLKAVDLFRAVECGEIKAIWIMATNPAVSMPDAAQVSRALRKCPLVVVSDCVTDTDTARCADLLLPATGWGEKDGTVTNSERRISRQRGFLPPPGEARHDWQIICDLANRLGHGEAFTYRHPADIFREHAALSGFENGGERAFDISALAGLTRRQYEQLTPVQWPVNAANPGGTARLFTDRRFFTGSGRAQFIPVEPRLPRQQRSQGFPLWLNSGRLRDQWHTMTRTARSRRLLDHSELPEIQLGPADAADHAIGDGQLVELRSARGRMRGRAVVNPAQPAGQLFAPIHWSESLAADSRVSALAEPVTDPHSGQPEFKQVAVHLRAVTVHSYLRLVCPAIIAERLQRQLDRLAGLEHWYRVPCDGGFRYELAFSAAPDCRALALELLEGPGDALRWQRLQLPGAERWLVDNGELQLLMFAAPDWRRLPDGSALEQWLQRPLPEKTAQLLRDIAPASPVVCSCMQVSRQQIDAAIEAGAESVEALGEALGCGTGCGSCKPEIAALLRTQQASVA